MHTLLFVFLYKYKHIDVDKVRYTNNIICNKECTNIMFTMGQLYSGKQTCGGLLEVRGHPV